MGLDATAPKIDSACEPLDRRDGKGATDRPGLDNLRTPLHELHLRLGAKMVPFAGYDMPLHYPTGPLKEHRHTRAATGLFDVSHMGQITLTSREGPLADVAFALERLIPIDVLGLPVGRQRYGFLTNDSGGIVDDLMIANLGDRLVLVVNASRKAVDVALLRANLPVEFQIDVLSRALVALQGPGAEAALGALIPDIATMAFLDVREATILGAHCLITRSGYTGEDGFEISLPERHVEGFADALLADDTVLPIGLGARDSLRLEAGLCLSGADIDAGTTPAEAALGWAIPSVRRRGGARSGGFPGADRILEDLATGSSRRRVGLRAEGRALVRAGAILFATEADGASIGVVTSGGFGPTMAGPVAMGYVPSALASPGTRLFAEVRGQRLPLVVTKMPFVPNNFKRP